MSTLHSPPKHLATATPLSNPFGYHTSPPASSPSASAPSSAARGENLDDIIRKRREELRRLREIRSSAESGARSEALLALAHRRINAGVTPVRPVEEIETPLAKRSHAGSVTPAWVTGDGEMETDVFSPGIENVVEVERAETALASGSPLDSRRGLLHALHKYGTDPSGYPPSNGSRASNGSALSDSLYIHDNTNVEDVQRRIAEQISPGSVPAPSPASELGSIRALLAELREEKERHQVALAKIRELEKEDISPPTLLEDASPPSEDVTSTPVPLSPMDKSTPFAELLNRLIRDSGQEDKRAMSEILNDLGRNEESSGRESLENYWRDRIVRALTGAPPQANGNSREGDLWMEDGGGESTPPIRDRGRSPGPRTPNRTPQMDLPTLRPYFPEAALSIPSASTTDNGSYHIRVPAGGLDDSGGDVIDWDRWGVEDGPSYAGSADPGRPETIEVYVRVGADESEATVAGEDPVLVHWGCGADKGSVRKFSGGEAMGKRVYVESDGSEGDYSLDEIYDEAIHWRNEYCTALIAASRAIHKSRSLEPAGRSTPLFTEGHPVKSPPTSDGRQSLSSPFPLSPRQGLESVDSQTQTDVPGLSSPPSQSLENADSFTQTDAYVDPVGSHMGGASPSPAPTPPAPTGLPPPQRILEEVDEGPSILSVISSPFRLLLRVSGIGWRIAWALARLILVCLVFAVSWAVLAEEEEALEYTRRALDVVVSMTDGLSQGEL